MKKHWHWLLIGLSGLLATAIGIGCVASGLIDRLSRDGAANKSAALWSLLIYWCLFSAGVLVAYHAKKYWKQMALFCFVLLMTLMVGEVMIQTLWPHLALRPFAHVPSPKFHHVMVPGRFHFGQFEGKEIVVTTNADGLRTSFSQVDFLRRPLRIACLGDSFTFGFGCNDDATYPYFLNRAMQEHLGTDKVAVLNGGVTSFSPRVEEVWYREKISQYRPNWVVLMLDCTDIGDDYKYEQEVKANRDAAGDFGSTLTPTQSWHLGALWRLAMPYREHPAVTAPWKLLGRVFGSQASYNYYDFQVTIDGVVEKNRFFIYRHPLEKTRSYFDLTWNNLRRLHESVKENGGKFVLFVAPRFHHWNTDESPDNWERDSYSLNEEHQYAIFEYFKEKAAIAPFPVITLLDDFRNSKEFPLCFRGDPHWNPTGNRLVAKMVKRHLTAIMKSDR